MLGQWTYCLIIHHGKYYPWHKSCRVELAQKCLIILFSLQIFGFCFLFVASAYSSFRRQFNCISSNCLCWIARLKWNIYWNKRNTVQYKIRRNLGFSERFSEILIYGLIKPSKPYNGNIRFSDLFFLNNNLLFSFM